MIESGIKFETSIPEVKINSQKNDNGTISITAGWTTDDIYKYVDMAAKEIYDKFDADLLDKLMEMNGCVKERTCHIDRRVPDAPFCYECTYDWDDDWNYCPNCGAKALND